MSDNLYLLALILFIVPFITGLITIIRRWSDDLLHLLLSYGAGIFLGVVFVHLLPETLQEGAGADQTIAILVGFLLIFFIERFLLSRDLSQTDHKHRVVSYTVLIGLSAHSLLEGFGLAVTGGTGQLLSVLFLSILIHKIPAAVALASLLSLAQLEKRQILIYLLGFSLTAPVGALLVGAYFTGAESGLVAKFTAVVTGSFLYVATGDLLPEVFHSRHHRWAHLALLLAGIVTMLLLSIYLPEQHA